MSVWKEAERVVAKYFGTNRTALSGGNSGGTRSDTRHAQFFIEVKYRQRFAVWGLFREVRQLARREDKLPLLALKEKQSQGFLVVVHSEDLERFIRCLKDSLE